MLFFAAPARTFDRRDPQQQRRFVADAFAGEGWELPTLLESMWRASDFYFDRASKVTLPRWTKGRVALVGDAAWGGSVGMGTSLAIVGAYVLAGELAAAGGNAEVALPRYEAELREFVRQNTGPMPGGLDGFLPPSRARIWFRNQVMRLMLASPWRQALTGGMQEAANAIALKAYA